MLFGKYKYTDSEEKELLDSIVILVDTREKVNDHITGYFDKHDIPYKKKALKNGDYSFFVPQNEKLGIFRDTYFHDDIFVERKASLEELSGNLSTKRADFEEELAVAKASSNEKEQPIRNPTYLSFQYSEASVISFVNTPFS